MLKRGIPVCGSAPTKESIRPRAPTSTPFTTSSPLTAPMKVIPRSARKNNSAGPNASTVGCTIGISAARNTAPNTPPTADAARLAPSARPPSPRRAIGWPSQTVAASGPVPGMPRRMLGMEPPVCTTECMATRNTQPGTMSIPNTSGIERTIPSLPPSPGTAPKIMPIGTAATMTSQSDGSATRVTKLR